MRYSKSSGMIVLLAVVVNTSNSVSMDMQWLEHIQRDVESINDQSNMCGRQRGDVL